LADPLLRLLEMPEAAEASRLDPVPEIGRYLVPSRVPQVVDRKDPWAAWVHLRPLSLNYWLRCISGSVINGQGGTEHELSIARRS
jgi:hypothetical protein